MTVFELKMGKKRISKDIATSPTNVRGSHPFPVGLTEEVQRQGNPRGGKKQITNE